MTRRDRKRRRDQNRHYPQTDTIPFRVGMRTTTYGTYDEITGSRFHFVKGCYTLAFARRYAVWLDATYGDPDANADIIDTNGRSVVIVPMPKFELRVVEYDQDEIPF